MSVRVAIYTRVSVDDVRSGKAKKTREEMAEEASQSIAAQLVAGRKLAKSRDAVIVDEPSDDGVSGHSGKDRAGFNSLLALVMRGEIDAIICRSIDRVGRNDRENSSIRLATKDKGVEWWQLDGSITDPTKAAGSFLINMQQTVAEYQSTLKSETINNVLELLRERGEIQAPKGTYGYDDNDRSKVVPVEAQRIRDAYVAIGGQLVDGQLVGGGRTVGSVVREWNDDEVPQRKGGSGWTYAHLNSILKRPRNAGLVAHKGEILEGAVGKWETIVDVELWHRVQVILNNPERRTSPGFQPVWLSSGIARCGTCGAVMRSNTVSDRRAGTRYPILRCSSQSMKTGDGSRHASARLSDLDALVRDAIVSAFLFGGEDLLPNDELPDLSGLLALRQRIVEDIEEVDYREREGLYSRVKARQRLAELKVQAEEVDAQLDAARAASASAHMLVDLRAGLFSTDHKVSITKAGEVKAALAERFDSLRIEQKRDLVGQLLTITVDRGRGLEKYRVEHKIVTSLNDSEAA